MIDVFLNLKSYVQPKKAITAAREERASFKGVKKEPYWQKMVDEIFVSGQVTLKDFAKELGVSKDTAERLVKHETQKPRQSVLVGLFVLHMLYCPHRYGQKPLERAWLIAQGWEVSLEKSPDLELSAPEG